MGLYLCKVNRNQYESKAAHEMFFEELYILVSSHFVQDLGGYLCRLGLPVPLRPLIFHICAAPRPDDIAHWGIDTSAFGLLQLLN